LPMGKPARHRCKNTNPKINRQSLRQICRPPNRQTA
jgi:hypothetical protein